MDAGRGRGGSARGGARGGRGGGAGGAPVGSSGDSGGRGRSSGVRGTGSSGGPGRGSYGGGSGGLQQQRGDQQQRGEQQKQRLAGPPGVEVKMGAKLVDRQLVFLPFFPSDNPGVVASADATETAQVLKLADEGLEELLDAPLHKFWSQLAYDPSLQVLLDSFLRYRRRAFDAANGASRDLTHVNEVAVQRVEEKLLQLLLRLSAHDGFGSELEADSEKLSRHAHSSLLYDTWLIESHRDVPKLLDMCAVFTAVDLVMTQKAVRNVMQAQPKYHDDLNDAVPLVCTAMNSSSTALLSLVQGPSSTATLSADKVKDICLYLTDCALTLLAFLRVYPEAAHVCWRHALLRALAASHCRLVAVTRRVSAIYGDGVIDDALQRRLRAASLDCAQSLILAMMQGEGAGGSGRGGGGGGAGVVKYLGRPVIEVVAEEVVGIGNEGGESDMGAEGWVFLRDLEFRHGLAARLTGGRGGGGAGDRGGVVQEAVEALKDSLSGKRKRAPTRAAGAAGNGAGGGGGGAGGAAEVDIEKVRQVRDILGESFGEGFVGAMLRDMDQSVERVIQALLEDNIPPSLASMDRCAPLQAVSPAAGAAGGGGKSVQGGGSRSVGGAARARGSALAERANVFDNDEFDVFKSERVRFEAVRIKGRNAEGRGQLEALAGDEAAANRKSTARLVKLQQVDEVRQELEAAQAELYAGDATAEERIARAQHKLDGLVAAFDAAVEEGGWEDGGGYDDEYDDAFDGFGFLPLGMSEGHSAEEAVAVMGHAAARRARKSSAAPLVAQQVGAASAAPAEEEDDDAECDDDDPDDPERGGGRGEQGERVLGWNNGAGGGNTDGLGGRVGAGAGRGATGSGRGMSAGGRGAGGGRGEGDERPSRGRGWGTANAKVARRKEENKSAIGNHHRKDRAARKMRMAAGFGPPA